MTLDQIDLALKRNDITSLERAFSALVSWTPHRHEITGNPTIEQLVECIRRVATALLSDEGYASQEVFDSLRSIAPRGSGPTGFEYRELAYVALHVIDEFGPNFDWWTVKD